MHRIRRWLPWLIGAALVIASRVKVPATQSAAVQLRLAAECGFVPGGQLVTVLAEMPVPTPPAAGLPGRRATQRECLKLATSAMAGSTTLGSRIWSEARHQWRVYRAGSTE